MKKLAVTIAIVLGLGISSFANPNGGGLFQRSEAVESNDGTIYGNRDGGFPVLPGHNQNESQPAPLGSGIALLSALGAAYLVGKRKHED